MGTCQSGSTIKLPDFESIEQFKLNRGGMEEKWAPATSRDQFLLNLS
jgi:hypothetical protein